MRQQRRRVVVLGSITILVAGFFIGAATASAVTPVAIPRISAPPDVVVSEGDGFVDLTVSLSAPGLNTVTVNYSTPQISATSSTGCPWDYAGSSGLLTFTPGQTTKVVRVDLFDCAEAEGLESFNLLLTNPNANGTIARAAARVDIVDNDTVVTTNGLFVRDAVVDESAGSVKVPVLLGGPGGQAPNGPISVHYTTSDAGATAGSDYTTASGTLNFALGDSVQSITVPITNDTTPEGAERIAITLSSPTGATIVHGTSFIVIAANDAPAVAVPRISAPPDVVVSEGDGYVDLPVSLSAPGLNLITVSYNTPQISAVNSTGCPWDYAGSSGLLTFAPGQTTKVVRVDLFDCVEAEGLESFNLALSSPNANATIARAAARVDIVDNDTVVTTNGLFVRDAVVDERAGLVSVPVLLGGTGGQAPNGPVTVHYATSNAGATAGNDYTAANGTLNFALGETVRNIVVPITNDTTPEGAERIAITLSSPTGATIVDGAGVIVIAANDASSVAIPHISAPPDVVVSEGDGYVDLPVSLSAPGLNTVTVNYSTPQISAVNSTGCPWDYAGSSGLLTFAPGETTKVVRVDLFDCVDAEGLESFNLLLANPNANATIARAAARVDIVDNDSGHAVYSYGISSDTYTIGASSDVIVENPAGGTDTVRTALSYTLPTNLENLVITGTLARNGTGNAAANRLTGNTAANTLSGLAGNDVLIGGAGADTLIGGPGADTITAGTGADVIVLNSLVGSDTITDFSHVDDTFRISMGGIPTGDGDAILEGATTRSAPGGFAKTAELVVFSKDIVGTITTTNAAAAIGSATTAYATGDNRLFVVDNGTSTAIYRFHSSAANAQVSAAELSLIATVKYDGATTSTTVADYTFAS